MPNTEAPAPKKMGRPKLPTGHAKGRIVPVRFSAEELSRIAEAAKVRNRTVSQWIRGRVSAAMEA